MSTNSSHLLDYRSPRLPRTLQVLMLVLAALFAIAQTHAQSLPKELHIAAASDLQPVLPALAAAYEHATGIKITASFGSTATLTEQLINGDPQDIFLAADFVHPEQLIAANLATGLDNKPAATLYARGVLVLWARKDSPAQPLTLDSLTKPSVQKISVANDLHAPYGMAATAALKTLRLTDALAPKLVVAENIAQAAQFAESGNAQAGLISLTTANTAHFRDIGTFVRFPAASYPPIRQCGVILKSSKDLSLANDFLRWLTSPAIQQNLPQYGLEPAN